MKKIATLLAGMVLAVPAFAFTVTISEPITDRAYIFPAQSIDVAVQITPQPRPEYTLLIVFDDKVVGNNQSTVSLPTSEYGLGNHTLKAILYNDQAQPIAQDERTVYVIPRSNLAREREAKEASQKAYEALPWYKKIGVTLRQGDNSLTVSPATIASTNPTTSDGVAVNNTGVNGSAGVQSSDSSGFSGVTKPVIIGIGGVKPSVEIKK